MASPLDALVVDDLGAAGLASNPFLMFGHVSMSGGDEYVRCSRCGFGGCDLRVSGCGCTLHARCIVLPTNGTTLQACTCCNRPASGLSLIPMSFREIDDAKESNTILPAVLGKGRKRKGSPGETELDSQGVYISERRTGRWTTEEMALCDKMIAKFESGELPISSNIKLNEFLGNMLKSKQSRLTKKMKNAKLSARTYQRHAGGILNDNEAQEFSELEDFFFQSISDPQDRAEIKFHMQREWREQFSLYCNTIGQPLDADAWLNSVEEMDRRSSLAKDAARMAKRKLMMGFALRTDRRNPDHGVFIEKSESDDRVARGPDGLETDFNEQQELLQLLTEEAKQSGMTDINGKSSLLHSAPFLSKTVAYMQRHNVPFEHLDIWVPSFVPTEEETQIGQQQQPTCRLCFAGSATLDETVAEDGKTKSPVSPESQFNLYAFGDYSQKFSFDVGCGLPGRVYESGRPTWEQSVQNAPHHHFERCGGALQWGIKTVVGIPIASPNVGRVVIVLYSTYDRPKDQDLVSRLSDEFTRLMPSPKWKLVVDVGEAEHAPPTHDTSVGDGSSEVLDSSSEAGKPSNGRDPRVDKVVSLLGELMPSDPNSALAPYLSGFMSLRLLLLKPSKSLEEEDRAQTMLDSYTSYVQGGRSKSDIGIMLARDYMYLYLSQQNNNTSLATGFFNVGQGKTCDHAVVPSLSGYLFDFDFQHSPMLGPVSVNDALSVVSNN